MSYSSIIESLRGDGNFRSIPDDWSSDRGVVDLSSNDYLGLAAEPDLQQEFFELLGSRMPAMTSSASRLLASHQYEYRRLESLLETLYGDGRRALLFNSGYHANTGLISALASVGSTLIVADRLVHASIIDGIVLSRAPFKRFPHNDFDRLEKILEAEASSYDRVIIVVESVYSMDGDCADIERLVALKRSYPNAILYVDEAHAFGVVGLRGLGLVMSTAGHSQVDIIVGTFGKAAASMGAFCVASPEIVDYAINKSRSFIFSTALPPMVCSWTRFVVNRMIYMDVERTHLRNLAERLHRAIVASNPDYGYSPSHITPYIIGNPKATVALSNRLLEAGFKVLPIRVPTVPRGTDRLRISLSAALDFAAIDSFVNALFHED